MSNESKPVGRPKKEPEYTHSALSIFRDPSSQHWKLVRFQYTTSGDVSDMEVLQTNPDKSEIDYQFRVTAANLNIVG